MMPVFPKICAHNMTFWCKYAGLINVIGGQTHFLMLYRVSRAYSKWVEMTKHLLFLSVLIIRVSIVYPNNVTIYLLLSLFVQKHTSNTLMLNYNYGKGRVIKQTYFSQLLMNV